MHDPPSDSRSESPNGPRSGSPSNKESRSDSERSEDQRPTSRSRNDVLRIEIHLFNHIDEGNATNLKVEALVTQGAHIMALLDALTAAVTKNTEVDESAVILLQGLKVKLDSAISSGDPAALQALSDQLGASTQKLADAVLANTPSDV